MGGWHMFLCLWWRTRNRDRNVKTGHGGLRGQSRKSTETHDFKIWIWYPKATGTNRDVVLLTSQPPCAGEKWRRRKITKWRQQQAVRSSTRVQNLTIYGWVDAGSGHPWGWWTHSWGVKEVPCVVHRGRGPKDWGRALREPCHCHCPLRLNTIE